MWARMLLAAFLFAVANPEDELRRPRAENKVLRAENKALRATVTKLRAKRPPVPHPAPAPREVVIRFPEDDPRWWRDGGAFAREFRLRAVVSRYRDDLALVPWLAGNRRFAGKRVRWHVSLEGSMIRRSKTRAEQRVHRARSAEVGARDALKRFRMRSKQMRAKEAEAERVRLEDKLARAIRDRAMAEQLHGAGGAILNGRLGEKHLDVRVRMYVPETTRTACVGRTELIVTGQVEWATHDGLVFLRGDAKPAPLPPRKSSSGRRLDRRRRLPTGALEGIIWAWTASRLGGTVYGVPAGNRVTDARGLPGLSFALAWALP